MIVAYFKAISQYFAGGTDEICQQPQSIEANRPVGRESNPGPSGYDIGWTGWDAAESGRDGAGSVGRQPTTAASFLYVALMLFTDGIDPPLSWQGVAKSHSCCYAAHSPHTAEEPPAVVEQNISYSFQKA
jgi:hypothetical protein